MKLSTKGRYAVTALFDLAAHGAGEPVSATAIAKRQSMPLPYLEQLLARLRKAGLVKTVRGPAGGYVLARLPGKISIGDIIRAADGPIALADCVVNTNCCDNKPHCSTRLLWAKLSKKISQVFDGTTLKSLCEEGE